MAAEEPDSFTSSRSSAVHIRLPSNWTSFKNFPRHGAGGPCETATELSSWFGTRIFDRKFSRSPADVSSGESGARRSVGFSRCASRIVCLPAKIKLRNSKPTMKTPATCLPSSRPELIPLLRLRLLSKRIPRREEEQRVQLVEPPAEPRSELLLVTREPAQQPEQRLAQYGVVVSKRKPTSRRRNRHNSRAKPNSSKHSIRFAGHFQPV